MLYKHCTSSNIHENDAYTYFTIWTMRYIKQTKKSISHLCIVLFMNNKGYIYTVTMHQNNSQNNQEVLNVYNVTIRTRLKTIRVRGIHIVQTLKTERKINFPNANMFSSMFIQSLDAFCKYS